MTFKTLNNLTNKTCGSLVGLERQYAGKNKRNYCEVFVMFGAVFDLDLAAVGRSLVLTLILNIIFTDFCFYIGMSAG